MEHKIEDIRTNVDSSQSLCSCGWESPPMVNTYAAEQQGKAHVKIESAGGQIKFESRPRKNGKSSSFFGTD